MKRFYQFGEVLSLIVIFAVIGQVEAFDTVSFLKRVMDTPSEPQENDMGGLNRLFYVLTAMRQNMKHGVTYADYLDSIAPVISSSSNYREPIYLQNRFLRIGRSGVKPIDHSKLSVGKTSQFKKRALPRRSRFVRIGKRVPFLKDDLNNDIGNKDIDKRGHYLQIGKLPISAFLRYSLGKSGNDLLRRYQTPISRSTLLRIG